MLIIALFENVNSEAVIPLRDELIYKSSPFQSLIGEYNAHAMV